MAEKVPEKLNWKWRETNDSEYGRAKFKCFEINVQDCDGDLTRWDIKRGDQYVAVGETFGSKGEYHLDAAMRIARETLVHLWRAVEMNDFVANEMPKLRAQGIVR